MLNDELILEQETERENQAADGYVQLYTEWLGVLRTMWEAIGKDVDEKRLAIYASQFEAIPLGLLEKAVARAIRNNGVFTTVPSVGAVWNAIKKETGDLPMDVLEAVELWTERKGAEFIYRFEKAGN